MISTQKKYELPGKPTKDQVEEQLSRILQSGELKLPPRATALLKFVVQEASAGRGDYLKAFTIATEVFGRDASFDAQSDPCVRIEAARVRRGLERFYLICGSEEPVEITIPKGGYRPVFALRKKADLPHTEAPPKPDRQADGCWHQRALNIVGLTQDRTRNVTLGVGATSAAAVVALALPLSAQTSFQGHEARDLKPYVVVGSFSGDADMSPEIANPRIGIDFRDEMILRLVSHREFAVFIQPPRTTESAEQVYTLDGAVRRDKGALRISARLVRSSDGVVVWAGSDDYPDVSLRNASETSATRFAFRIAHRLAKTAAVSQASSR